jgi:DNA-binding CsgD family transcriptional regulator/PAS domain-containing protein
MLTRLIGEIYDAVLDSALWSGILAGIGEFVGGRAGGIVSRDSVSRASTPHYHFGLDPHYVEIYSERHSKLDPMSSLPLFDVERIVSLPELGPYDEICAGRFFREWMRPQGLVDAANAVLDKSVRSCSFLTILRDEASGMVDAEMRRRMALVVPHVRRAVLIGKALELKQARAATFADIFDGLSAGVFFVDANGRIVHVNAAGKEMLSAGDFLRSSGGRLVASDGKVNHTLRETVAAAVGGDGGIGSKGIAVPLNAQDGEPYVAHVLSLSTGERHRAGAASAAAAALFVRKAALEYLSPPEVIGATYNLTPAELRVLRGIVDIGGVPEVAAAFGIAETTVKTHLSRLFDKTGAVRQADLVKLVAGYSNLLAA